jgi:hypothetical protein
MPCRINPAFLPQRGNFICHCVQLRPIQLMPGCANGRLDNCPRSRREASIRLEQQFGAPWRRQDRPATQRVHSHPRVPGLPILQSRTAPGCTRQNPPACHWRAGIKQLDAVKNEVKKFPPSGQGRHQNYFAHERHKGGWRSLDKLKLPLRVPAKAIVLISKTGEIEFSNRRVPVAIFWLRTAFCMPVTRLWVPPKQPSSVSAIVE